MEMVDLLLQSKEAILREKSEESLFSFYFGETISLHNKYTNPLRADKTPDCTFFYGDNDLVFRDWARKKTYTVFDFVCEKFGLTYEEALRKIILDHNIVPPKLSSKDKFLLDIKAKEIAQSNKLKKINKIQDLIPVFSKDLTKHFEYFNTFDFSFDIKLFKKFKIYGIDNYYMKFPEKTINIPAKELGFIYFFDSELKEKQVYLPFADKKYKFRQIIKSTIIGQSFLREDEYVIVTKSYKDFVILQICGFNACCILSENYKPNMMDLTTLRKFGKKRIFTLFDNDNTGHLAGEEWKTKFKSIPILLSEEMKDAYKHYKTFGKEDLTNTINNLIWISKK